MDGQSLGFGAVGALKGPNWCEFNQNKWFIIIYCLVTQILVSIVLSNNKSQAYISQVQVLFFEETNQMLIFNESNNTINIIINS